VQQNTHRSDWKVVHEKLITLARTRAGLEWEEGDYLLRAFDWNLHVRFGFASFVEYVERLFGHSPRLTMEKVRVARALLDLGETSKALRAGEISWSAVRELTRVATPETEPEWLAATENKTVREVERMVSGRLPGDSPADERDPRLERHVLRFEVTAETRSTFQDALAKLTRDTGEHLNDDALLLLMARQVLGGPVDEGRSSYQITMTVCERCSEGTQTGKGEANPVDRVTVEMANCDAVQMPDAHVGVGKRAAQSIPPAVRRLVMQRHSGKCCVPGCRHSIFVDVHHLSPREEGGGHDPENLVVLCAAHHRALHRGTLRVMGCFATGLEFHHADGSRYGEVRAPAHADELTKVFQALRSMGFREKDARGAVERANAHVGIGASTESLLRRALAEVTP
jgi:5-methylcytosine-specific restriction endonuclease McrA